MNESFEQWAKSQGIHIGETAQHKKMCNLANEYASFVRNEENLLLQVRKLERFIHENPAFYVKKTSWIGGYSENEEKIVSKSYWNELEEMINMIFDKLPKK